MLLFSRYFLLCFDSFKIGTFAKWSITAQKFFRVKVRIVCSLPSEEMGKLFSKHAHNSVFTHRKLLHVFYIWGKPISPVASEWASAKRCNSFLNIFSSPLFPPERVGKKLSEKSLRHHTALNGYRLMLIRGPIDSQILENLRQYSVTVCVTSSCLSKAANFVRGQVCTGKKCLSLLVLILIWKLFRFFQF